MEEIEFKLKEISKKISMLRDFMTREFSEIISHRFMVIEEEMERMKKEIDKRLKAIEARLIELKLAQSEEKAYREAKERLLRKIDKSVLKELEE